MNKPGLRYPLIFLVLFSLLPSLAGFVSTSATEVYSGVVFNPIDGYSYLAKMEIGKSGEWLFRLPYTINPGEGRFLYPFYIFFGAVFGWLNIPLSVGFNLLRLAAYSFLIIILVRFSELLLGKFGKKSILRILILSAGGGLGWLLLPFGKFGADFWVSEAYPFLSGLANPHFPLAIALMVFSLELVIKSRSGMQVFLLSATAFLLSVLSPFGFVLMAFVLVIYAFWEYIEGNPEAFSQSLTYILFGLPYSMYQYWAVSSTPQLAAWTAQNQTPTPAIWDLLISFTPWIFLIILGWRSLWQRRHVGIIRLLGLWLLSGILLIILPLDLQRRFLIGFYIPVTGLGLFSIEGIAKRFRMSANSLLTICAATVFPTSIIILIMTTYSILSHNPIYFQKSEELSAINWLSVNYGKKVIVAPPQTGLWVPAVSRIRVVYGHPFETIDAEFQKQRLIDFYNGNYSVHDEKKFLMDNSADWIIFESNSEQMNTTPKILMNKKPSKMLGSFMLFKVLELLH